MPQTNELGGIMTQQPDFHIIIIDDNPAIHQDFIKILAAKQSLPKLENLKEELFGSAAKDSETAISLPQFYVDTASQGQEGVERIKNAIESGTPYALAFVDIRMPPGWDGIETIKHIWELDQDIQIVICTAFSDYSWESTIKELGMHDNLLILKKPFDTVAIRQLACALTKKWQLMQESRAHTAVLEKRVQERTSNLQHSLSVTRATLESSLDGIVVVDNTGKITDYNQQFVDMWKIQPSLMETKDYNKVLESMLTQLKKSDDSVKVSEEFHNNSDETKRDLIYLKDNRIFERFSQPHTLQGQIAGRVWSFRDVTKRILLEKKLEKQATHDALTGLPNRILLMDRIQQAINREKREGKSFAVIFFDLDRFKVVNDNLSHQAGDVLLQAIAKRLRTEFRMEDTLARLGGDEFVMVISSLDENKSILGIITKLLDLFKQPFKILNQDIFMSASFGVSLYPEDGVTPDELLSHADLAMYHSKSLGSNQFQFYKSELNQTSFLRLKKENDLRHAIENQEFFLNYQTEVDLETQKIISVEALIRWQHPQEGIISPIDFIPFAEETGLIIPIGEWVLKTACAQNKAWQDQGFPPIRISVNVANLQFKDSNFINMVKDTLKKTGLKPEYLELEVTENVIISNPEVMNVINELKKIGVKIALDDFGTGNSSLNYLKKVNIDRLKIDQSFVQQIDLDKRDEIIIKAIIDMAQSLNYEVVAEGVEAKNQLTFLQDKECELGQGYYFSKPMSNQDIETLFKGLCSSPPK